MSILKIALGMLFLGAEGKVEQSTPTIQYLEPLETVCVKA